jgi:hypothetical protein
MSDLIACPFCGDTGFDHVGLKNHLLTAGWCEAWDRADSDEEWDAFSKDRRAQPHTKEGE